MGIVIEAEGPRDATVRHWSSVATRRHHSTSRTHADPQAGAYVLTDSVDRDGSAPPTFEARKRNNHYPRPGQVSFD